MRRFIRVDFPTLGFPTMFTKPALCIGDKKKEVEEVVAMYAMNAMNALKVMNALKEMNKSRLSEKREGKE